MHDDEVPVGVELVARLIAEQYPHWSDLELRPVEPWGTDNAIWRLGEDQVVRLPRIAWAKEQPAREAKWLPVLASHLPVAIPEPVALGRPNTEYPFTWSVHRWLPGEPASPNTIDDRSAFADSMIDVIRRLGEAPTDGAPRPHNRARPLAEYDESARQAISSAADLIEAEVALEIWEAGLAAEPHGGSPRWVHGDLEGNCLVLDGHLSGLIDWGSACVGDLAVDVQVAWSPLFTDESRARFLERLNPSHATVERAKAMAIQQACAALPYYLHTYPLIVERSWHKLAALGVPTKVERF
jgi:aminoglycoside phosphotransferase (APT) family kinase protein